MSSSAASSASSASSSSSSSGKKTTTSRKRTRSPAKTRSTYIRLRSRSPSPLPPLSSELRTLTQTNAILVEQVKILSNERRELQKTIHKLKEELRNKKAKTGTLGASVDPVTPPSAPSRKAPRVRRSPTAPKVLKAPKPAAVIQAPVTPEETDHFLELLFSFDSEFGALPFWPLAGKEVVIFPHVMAFYDKCTRKGTERLQISRIWHILKTVHLAHTDSKREQKLLDTMPVVGQRTMYFLSMKTLIRLSKSFKKKSINNVSDNMSKVVNRYKKHIQTAKQQKQSTKLFVGSSDESQKNKLRIGKPVTLSQLQEHKAAFQDLLDLRNPGEAQEIGDDKHLIWDLRHNRFAPKDSKINA